MSLYADQHMKKLERGQAVGEHARLASEKENTRFRRSSRPALPIGSPTKCSGAASAADDSPAPRSPSMTPIAASGAMAHGPLSQSRQHNGKLERQKGREGRHQGPVALGTPVSASHTPSTLHGTHSTQPSPASAAAEEVIPAAEQEAVAELLTRASEALKAERAKSTVLAAEKAELLGALQQLCDYYMALESTLTAVTIAPARAEGSPDRASSALLGLQVRELAEKHQLRLPAPQRSTLALLTPREGRGDSRHPATATATAAAALSGSPASTPRSAAATGAGSHRGRAHSARPSRKDDNADGKDARRSRGTSGTAGAATARVEPDPLPRVRSASAIMADRAVEADGADGTMTVFAASRGAAAQEAMASRLRRALAPQPTREQVGNVIDAMVDAIQQDPARVIPAAGVPGGPRFRLTRVSACTYRLTVGTAAALHAHAQAKAGARAALTGRPTSPRRGATDAAIHESLIHLVINSGALRVVRGGGPVDFFDFMDRKLRSMQRHL